MGARRRDAARAIALNLGTLLQRGDGIGRLDFHGAPLARGDVRACACVRIEVALVLLGARGLGQAAGLVGRAGTQQETCGAVFLRVDVRHEVAACAVVAHGAAGLAGLALNAGRLAAVAAVGTAAEAAARVGG